MKLNQLTIKQAQEKLEKKEISSVELTEACFERIKEIDDKVKACITVCEKEAMEWARKADRRRESGEQGELLGIPYIAKDNILTKGIKTTDASKILENYIAPYDATIIRRLKKAGAVLLAKANLDEFAHGASTENSVFDTSHNPWDFERVPGGSSGGSAAAVAADMCLFALGTDTGGSIRHPAGFCGVNGLKPSYGRSSRFGLIAMTSSTDVPGPITKTAEDASSVLKTIAGKDKHDATTLDAVIPNYQKEINKDIKGLKIGLPQEYFDEGLNDDVKKVIDQAIVKYKDFGAEIVDISLPHTKYGVAAYYIITPSEISSNLARFDGIRFGYTNLDGKTLEEIYKKSRGEGFGPEVKRRIMLGTYTLSAGYFDAYYLQAQKVRTIIKEEMDQAFAKVDVLLTPTSPHIAFKIGEQSDNPLSMYLEDVFMVGASLAGLSAISIPAGFSRNMPVGMHLIGPRLGEGKIFQVANIFQQNTDFHLKKPEL
ncbi:MAG: Asp-tRNA(Asn)/Glu-tRNA(Gln) amidotransferase subunit GatA [Patescibacteria group bacterium]|nr:Asp-tRNA(Asn)/Glu-tRNA(Gln) amidotransferase subunit GatA [Patescibacteria group bacterium]